MAKKNRPYLGIDLGGTNVTAAVVTAEGQVLGRDKTKTKAIQGSDAVIKRIAKVCHGALEEAGLTLDDVEAAGIGAPGAINIKSGIVIRAVNLDWKHYPLADVLRKQLGVPVVVDNDVNVAVWGEFVAGAAKSHGSALGVWVGTGVGGGIVLNGELFYGHYMTAGEIGHTLMLADGPLGRCTLENLSSRTAVARLAQQLIESGHNSIMSELTEGNLSNIRSKVLATAVRRNDAVAKEVLKQAGHYLGVSIANTVTLMSLPCVVLGGGLTQALTKSWVQTVRQSFEKHVFPSELTKCQIVVSTLGDDAGVIGAALLAQKKATKDST